MHGRGGRGGGGGDDRAVERATHGRAMGGHCAAAIRRLRLSGWHSNLSHNVKDGLSRWRAWLQDEKEREGGG